MIVARTEVVALKVGLEHLDMWMDCIWPMREDQEWLQVSVVLAIT